MKMSSNLCYSLNLIDMFTCSCDSNVFMYYSNSSILINTVHIHNTAAISQLEKFGQKSFAPPTIRLLLHLCGMSHKPIRKYHSLHLSGFGVAETF